MTTLGSRTPRRWTLRTQVVLGVCAVMMAVQVIVGAISVLTLCASVNNMVSTQLSGSLDAFSHTVNKIRASMKLAGTSAPSSPMKALTEFTGQAPGNLIMLMRDGHIVDSALFSDGEQIPAPGDVVRDIEGLPQLDGVARTITLAGLGDYRVQGRAGDGTEVLVSGVSMARADQIVQREAIIVAALTVVALLLTAGGTFVIVRLALRPLARVAATASEVATLPLGREHHAIAVRVDATDTDPRTEVGLVGDTLNRLLAHVEGALTERAATDRRMRQFITDASHELRTPLAAIQGYAELTRQDSAVLPETTEYSLARIEAEAQRMNALVSDLLLLARLDEGQDLDAADVDLTGIVADAVNDAAAAAPGHSWQKHVSDAAVWIRGDQARLYQLLANLLSNARVHTPVGTTVTTMLTTRSSDDGTTAELCVIDDGPGIDAELLPHLFERFVRADKSRSRQSGSAGLGLSIVASIVEAHHGTITVESRSGWTSFLIRLPVITPPLTAPVEDHADLQAVR